MEMPWKSRLPSSATRRGAWSSVPTELPPETSTTSAAASISASRIRSARSGRISKGSTTARSRASRARSTTELLSTMRGPSGRLPAGRSSSPVTTSCTRGRRTQRGRATPMEARSPASWGRRRRPARRTNSPLRMSSPAAPTCFRGATASVTSTRPSRSLHTSAITTASAPSGSFAPVMTRTAFARSTAPSKRVPGSASPTTSNGTGSYAEAPNVSSPRTA